MLDALRMIAMSVGGVGFVLSAIRSYLAALRGRPNDTSKEV